LRQLFLLAVWPFHAAVAVLGGFMSEKKEELDRDAINAAIKATFEKIGRIVVYSEKLRYQLVDAIAMAEAGPELVDPEWSSLNERLRTKFRDSPLTKIVERLERALITRYSTDKKSQAVVRTVCEQCMSLLMSQ
jgi:hypothetical protein